MRVCIEVENILEWGGFYTFNGGFLMIVWYDYIYLATSFYLRPMAVDIRAFFEKILSMLVIVSLFV